MTRRQPANSAGLWSGPIRPPGAHRQTQEPTDCCVTEHRVRHLERLRHGGSAILSTKVGTSWAGWLAAEFI